MKNSKKSIFSRTVSGLLAFLTVFTLMASLSLVPVFAADSDSSSTERLFTDIYTDYYTNPSYAPDKEGDVGMINPDFTTPENRLAAMEKMYTKGNFELYVDKISGEVALKDVTTDDIIFSNPYDLAEYNISGENSISKTVKPELLSQINISYNDNGHQASYNSFTDAALLGQITVKKLRGGVRVEYSIGEEETRNLVPRIMSYARYEEMLLSQLYANVPESSLPVNPIVLRFTAFYEQIKINKNASPEYKDELLKQYPALKKYDETTSGIAVFTGEAYREIKQIERYIKMYCPKYTFEEMDKDHMDVGYTSKDKAPANFRLALEYYLNDFGVEVRFPANGLSFDESAYELNSISILPYMGAGVSDYTGYTLLPDGSGTLMRFEDVEKYFNVTGKIYGDDYAYQEISGSNQEVFRMPVFGIVTNAEKMDPDKELIYRYDPNPNDENNPIKVSKQEKTYASGYVAIITEGDALASITSLNGGGDRHPFNSAYCSFNPRPKDSFNLAEAISVGGDSKVTVVSKRKYTGSFKINYIMLTDPAKQTDENRTYYDTTYVGMAKAYRDYLEKTGTISRIKDEEVKDANGNLKGIPFYIEAFGVTETDESFMSIPVTVKKPMTTFKQLEKMIDECQTAGISNIGLRLTGYTNGGMYATVPTKVKFEKVVGGNDGFTAFLKTAASKGVSVYPDFDFAYMSDTGSFDGFSYSSDAVKTIDNRYITKREYSAVLQTFSTTGKICISPCVYRDYFESFDESFKEILGKQVTNVSLGTLGSDLNSDFDDDDPYNREDAKNFTLELLKSFDVSTSYGDIMIDAGNAYAMQYATVVLNAPLDSSRYAYASEAIPFFGMVYHGYVVFAGSPTNMAGDIKYETLKILENGATLYMMLSYDNVELLKEDPMLSRYYAVNYEIWKKTLFDTKDEAGNVTSLGLYSKLNNALKSVQTSLIDDHGFINCMRKFTPAEMENIRHDALKRHNEEFASVEATYKYYKNQQDIYFDQILRNKEQLVAEGIYDNRAELEALVDEFDDDALTPEKYAEIVSYSTDDVVVNALVLQAIIDYYGDNTAKGEEYQRKMDTYRTILKNIDSLGYWKIEAIVASIEEAEAQYVRYVGENGADSIRLTEIINELSAEYDQNRVVNDGSVVFVKYDNGQYFILNYNNYIIEITPEMLAASGIVAPDFPTEGIEIAAKDFYVKGGN